MFMSAPRITARQRRIDRIKALMLKGFTLREAAEKLGISHQRASQLLRLDGVPAKRGRGRAAKFRIEENHASAR